MSNRTQSNEAFQRNIYAKGPFQGHGFVCVPPYIGICELPDYDFTLSEKPVSHWVPWMVENYRRLAEFVEKVGDDSVPTARLSTGTHIFAAAFGCIVHRFRQQSLRRSSDRGRGGPPVPEMEVARLSASSSSARLVQKELGKTLFIGPPDMQMASTAS